MNIGTEMTRRDYRRAPRLPAAPAEVVAVPGRSRTRWSRRRGVVSCFGAFAAVGFLAAYIGPLGGAVWGAQASGAVATSLYSLSTRDAQSFQASEQISVVSLDRGGYTAFVSPKPTPTPSPTVSVESDQAREVAERAAPARPPYSGGGSAAEWMAAAGIAESDRGYVEFIVRRESSWNPNATNPSSGACGLVQALPCSKVPGNGYDPIDNLRWASGYAEARYGGWAPAYDFWTRNHWW